MTRIQKVSEGKARILIAPSKKISKEMEVFYNPDMKLNRDIAIALLNSLNLKNISIADPLAGTGVRAIRLLLELKSKPKEVKINDLNQKAYRLIRKNLRLNRLKISKKINVFNEDANLFLLRSHGFNYIDIDPFGSPNYFLDASIKRLSRAGILAVTATDTSALCGSYVNACMRKYWAFPLRNELMHEIGIRILIRKVQLVGAQYEKALIPIFSHSTKHYMRVYFHCKKSNEKVNKTLKLHKFFLYCTKCFNRKESEFNNEKCSYCRNEMRFAGPLWTGKLWGRIIVSNMVKFADKDEELLKLLNVIEAEAKINSIGYYDINKICSRLKVNTPKKEVLISKIRAAGYMAAGTHFNQAGIRSDIDISKLIKLLTH